MTRATVFGPASSITAEDLGLRPPAVSSITAEDLGRIPHAPDEPESSGFEAAQAAAEESGSSSSTGAEGSSSEEPAGPGAAMLFVDMVLVLGVQLAAQRYKVPSARCAVLARLSSDERALLEQFAPYATPFLGAAGEASPIVGALAFAGVSAMILAGRFRDVRGAASLEVQKGAAAPSARPSSSAAAPVDLEHLSRWGALVDVIPKGAELRDSGAFPDATAN